MWLQHPPFCGLVNFHAKTKLYMHVNAKNLVLVCLKFQTIQMLAFFFSSFKIVVFILGIISYYTSKEDLIIQREVQLPKCPGCVLTNLHTD